MMIDNDWLPAMGAEFRKPYYKTLYEFVKNEYNTTRVFPPADDIFNAFHLTPLSKVKVVIIGQDPYHEPGQAQGLSFSVPENFPYPPSLVNIFKEIEDDLHIKCLPSGDLTRWAKQGVLLLNTVLTVRKGQANSHKDKGWEKLTSKIIEILGKKKEPIVFMLWGSYAQSFEPLIESQHLVLKAPHPSPLSAYRGFFGCKHFSKCNQFLQKNGQTPIDWK